MSRRQYPSDIVKFVIDDNNIIAFYYQNIKYDISIQENRDLLESLGYLINYGQTKSFPIDLYAKKVNNKSVSITSDDIYNVYARNEVLDTKYPIFENILVQDIDFREKVNLLPENHTPLSIIGISIIHDQDGYYYPIIAPLMDYKDIFLFDTKGLTEQENKNIIDIPNIDITIYKIPMNKEDSLLFSLWILDVSDNDIEILTKIYSLISKKGELLIEGKKYRNLTEFLRSYGNFLKTNGYYRNLYNNNLYDKEYNGVYYLENKITGKNQSIKLCGSSARPNFTPINDNVSTYNEILIKTFQIRRNIGFVVDQDSLDQIITYKYNKNDENLSEFIEPESIRDKFQRLILNPNIEYIPILTYFEDIDTGESQYIVVLFIRSIMSFYMFNMFDIFGLRGDFPSGFEDFYINMAKRDIVNVDYDSYFINIIKMRKFYNLQYTALFSIWKTCNFISTIEFFELDKYDKINLFNDLNIFFRGLTINRNIGFETYKNGLHDFLLHFGNEALQYKWLKKKEKETPKYILPTIPYSVAKRKEVFAKTKYALGSRWEGTFEYELKGFKYLFNKHSNFCTFGSDKNDNFNIIMEYSPPSDIYREEFKFNQKSIDNLKYCLNGKNRFIIISLTFCKDIESKKCHANILIYDKVQKELERFEPHGEFTNYDVSNMDNRIREELEKYIPIEKYYLPLDFCPSQGFQKLEESKLKTEYDYNGYCLAWSIWYADLRLSNPDIDRKEIVDYAINEISLKTSFKKFIREYSDYLASL